MFTIALLMVLAGAIAVGSLVFMPAVIALNLPALLAAASTALAGFVGMEFLKNLPEILRALIGG